MLCQESYRSRSIGFGPADDLVTVLTFLKETLAPASITTMMALLIGGAVLLHLKPRWGRIWLTAVVLGYWAMTSPAGAAILARSMATRHAPLQNAEGARGATAVVLLGGGSNNIRAVGSQLSYVSRGGALRAIETARVYHLLGDPLVIVSGGVTDRMPGAAPESDAYRAALLTLGVQASRIVNESESANTRDQAVILKRVLRERHIDRFVLVTSPLHMERSLATFAAQGLYPTPSPSPLYADRRAAPFAVVPNAAAFEVSDGVLYEWLAWVYYWWQGWTRPAVAAA